MELIVKGQFIRDLSSYKNKALLKEVYAVVKRMDAAKDLTAIKNLKKLNDYKFLYRIKISDNYRMGLKIQHNKIWLVRFGHRSNFYKEFP
jgi:mRNA-degrading endonuclease RelE of RelBE toxin-antitoxin system